MTWRMAKPKPRAAFFGPVHVTLHAYNGNPGVRSFCKRGPVIEDTIDPSHADPPIERWRVPWSKCRLCAKEWSDS